MIDWLRNLLLFGMAAVVLMLVIEWGKFQEERQPEVDTETTLAVPEPDEPESATPAPEPESDGETPSPPDAVPQPETQPSAEPESAASSSQLVEVKTDRLSLLIDTHGGDIVKVALPQHKAELERDDPLVLLNRNASITYVAQSGLVGQDGTDLADGERPTYSVDQQSYQMGPDQETLAVDLELDQNGVQLTKRYTFHRDRNLIQVDYQVDNQSDEAWQAHFYGQIKRDSHEPTANTGFGMRSYLGAATTLPGEGYEKYDFGDMADDPLEFRRQGGWVAMMQHYFLSAWVADAEASNNFYLRKLSSEDLYLMGFTGPAHQVDPGQQGELGASFYVGPRDIKRLDEIAPELERTIDYGPLWFLSLPLFYFLSWIHGFVNNWGVAIILLVVSVKAAFFHLSAAGFRSMARMRKFAPKMNELKERYGDNRQKFSEEMIKLYKKEKINPMKGCLPMLLQMPVFLALYWVLMESVELRHASFLWINDLSVKDPIFILPLIYGATFWFQMRLNPPAQDPTQQKVMQAMPFVFTIMFMFFPAGLVLYWVVNGVLSIAQQWVITRQIERGEAKA